MNTVKIMYWEDDGSWIGYLDVGSKASSADEFAAFLNELRGLGYLVEPEG